MAGVLLTAAPAQADHIAGYRWREPSVVVEDHTGVDYIRQAAAREVDLWNQSGAALTLSYRDGPVDNTCGYVGPVIGICRTAFTGANEGYAGLAYFRWDADMLLIGAYFDLNSSIFADFASGPAIERNRIIGHEIGHDLGLNHSADPASIMNPDQAGDLPSAHDYEALRTIYGPAGVITTTTTTTTGASGASTTTTAPPTTTTTVPPTTTTTTAPPVTLPSVTTTSPPTIPPARPSAYCEAMRAARAQVDVALSAPGLERYRATALARFDLALAGC